MQLILDADEIDIIGNMSTIEHESLSEKFLANKIVEHLTDDTSNGNKENIQKQDNIISEQAAVENNNDTNKDVDTNKDITISKELSNNVNGESSKEDTNAEDEIGENLEEVNEISKNEEKLDLRCDNDTIEIVENKNCQDESTETTKEEHKEGEKEGLDKDVSIPEKNTAIDECLVVEDSKTIEAPTNSNNDAEIEEIEIEEIKSDTIVDEDFKKESQEKELPCLESQIDDNKLTECSVDKSTELVTNLNSSQNAASIDVPGIDMETTNSISNEKSEIEVGDAKIGDEKKISGDTEKNCSVDVAVAEVKTTNSSCNNSNTSIEIVDEDLKVNPEYSEKDTSIETVDENAPSNKKPEVSTIANETNSNSFKEVTGVSEKMEINDDSNATVAPTSPHSNVVAEKAKEDILEPKRFCRLSNNLEIFSDEEDDSSATVLKEPVKDNTQHSREKQCISLDDDDDIMLIDEDPKAKDTENLIDSDIKTDKVESDNVEPLTEGQPTNKEEPTETPEPIESCKDALVQKDDQDNLEPPNDTLEKSNIADPESAVDKNKESQPQIKKKPLLPKNFIKSYKKNLADMTRDELEEFCILKIVESIVDRSNLGEIKSQLKNLTQTMEECKKKCLMLSKQNKDLQVVLKSVQEDQKSGSDNHITPLKITRSVGMQVVMVADKGMRKRQLNGVASPAPVGNTANNKSVKSPITPNTKTQKERNSNNEQIPVPRLVPAVPATKANQISTVNNSPKQVSNIASPNGVRIAAPPPPPKTVEKRPRLQSITVDLTDDEPPAKVQTVQRTNMNQTLRVAGNQPPTNIVAAPRYGTNINSPRKVYIPISGAQAQNVRPGQSIMLKAVSGPPPRQRFPAAKVPQVAAPMRLTKLPLSRHPAPLPEVAKQYQPANWRSLPPAPDLKLSKVENGIVISWKIDNYQEENHEQIASYQLYAYQETQSPPSTALWKKIGDVKALPLPMACTLTQFMAGYKYYFAVRAVDVRSRFGPFSLPGSILLLNKL